MRDVIRRLPAAGLFPALFLVLGALPVAAQAPAPAEAPSAAAPAGPAGPVDLAAAEPVHIGHRLTFRSAALGEERPIFVRLPASYPRFASQRYPVLVLLDGDTHFHHASGLADYLALQGVMPEVIVVAVPNVARARDFTQVADATIEGSGGGPRFASFLADELVPWLDANYRTAPFRILFGHSLTGQFALWTLGEKPGLFSAVVAASPWVIWNQGWLVDDTDRRWRREPPGGRFAYLTAGDEPELLPTLDRYRSVLRTRAPKSLAWHYRPLPQDDHGTLVPATLDHGLRWVFDGWRLDERVVDLAELRRHYARLSERLGWQVDPPEQAVNLQGYRNLFADRIEPALELFRANAAAHPQSANVHDSLGEGLERAGRLDEAAASYRRAVEIARRTGDPFLATFEQHLAAAERRLAETAAADGG